MKKNSINRFAAILILSLVYVGCVPSLVQKSATNKVPSSYKNSGLDTANSAQLNWKEYFSDSYLVALIDTALSRNQELNIIIQEIEISKNEIRTRKGEYLPFLHLRAGSGTEKVGRYTSQGANDANTEIAPGKDFPDPLADFALNAQVNWEVDIWHKLRNAKKAAVMRYLATVEGKNFMVTNLVSEIAHIYYELLALDNQLDILKKNIKIQEDALEMVKQQKMAAKATELGVRKFEAEVLKNQSNQFFIEQEIIEAENALNFLLGRYPQTIQRDAIRFNQLKPYTFVAGVPSQLLQNRPDIRQAEQNLAAAKLDVQVAKANFYPSFSITAGLGYQAFNPVYLVKTPESMLYSLAGDLIAPVINRNGIIANYSTSNAKQIQAVYSYEQTILKAYTEVVNQLSKIDNLSKSYELKTQQVQALNESITISINLFQSARADYMEVLLTQRDALESKIELIETKKLQMQASIKVYQALGGGWK